MNAFLVLDDGTVFEGQRLGIEGVAVGEVVFNTGMTGYQEILSDPSYAGQIVLFTYPLIGNYGINDDDFESDRVQPKGIIVKEDCVAPSNWRSRKTLNEFLIERNIVSICRIDTRALTKRIRTTGVTMGAISTVSPDHAKHALAANHSYGTVNWVSQVTTKAPYAWGFAGRESIDEKSEGYRCRLAVLDCGLKFNILRRFAALGARCIVFPSHAHPEEILAWNPDGIVLSPGPGDPALLEDTIRTVRDLIGKKPVLGICLGNQLLCHAMGGSTYKLKFGHRGSNHPVKDYDDGTVTITSQNHGYAVDEGSLAGLGIRVTQRNLNDETVEGIEVAEARATSIQYHPEAAPGPWDSRKYFVKFIETVISDR